MQLGITDRSDADRFSENVKAVTFSDERLVTVRKTSSGEWELQSLKPFSSEEQLVIAMHDGSLIRMKVTDVQESTNLEDFLTDFIFVAAEIELWTVEK